MIRQSVVIILFSAFITACRSDQPFYEEKGVSDVFHCRKGEMTYAWYEHGKNESIPVIPGLPAEFLIVVDTHYKASNFISFAEEWARERAILCDTADLNWQDNEQNLTTRQKLKIKEATVRSYLKEADSLHTTNNRGQQQVWIINNSKDTVEIQMQDWSFICVLQARTKSGEWAAIQYWRFSTCGNSYYNKFFPPKTASSFITKLPTEGDYSTMLRYKLLGKTRYYYSNEFPGKINYCEFVEDSTTYNTRRGTPMPHFKLDSMMRLSMF